MKRLFLLLTTVLALAGCENLATPTSSHQAVGAVTRQQMPGTEFIGRRMYKEDYKVWGWVRLPDRPWSTAKLVMMNEQRVLAPDRAINKIGSDNGYEYRLTGYFSGETVYEPASDGFYPEFVLQNAQLLSTNPPNIYKYERQNDPSVRILQPPN